MLVYPNKYVNITQGRFGSYSHMQYNAYDLANKTSAIEKLTFYGSWKVTELKYNTCVVAQSQSKIKLRDGSFDYITLLLWHSNGNQMYKLGQTLKPLIYYEGTSGNATGNHVHLEIGKGKLKTIIVNGATHLPQDKCLNIERVFYVPTNYQIINDQNYSFRTTNVTESYTHKVVAKKVSKYTEPYLNKRNTHLGYLEKGDKIEAIRIKNNVLDGFDWLRVLSVYDNRTKKSYKVDYYITLQEANLTTNKPTSSYNVTKL